ncbi:hypothetical protein DER45DRAFT_623904 [Fusarium avenaceum]|nr:hypothetical protein DER45DRAFT_623904 [Fusarium avenaceum]
MTNIFAIHAIARLTLQTISQLLMKDSQVLQAPDGQSQQKASSESLKDSCVDIIVQAQGLNSCLPEHIEGLLRRPSSFVTSTSPLVSPWLSRVSSLPPTREVDEEGRPTMI